MSRIERRKALRLEKLSQVLKDTVVLDAF